MAEVDLFGKPITGDQHSPLFKKLTGKNIISEKERYEAENRKYKERLEAMKYAKKREALEEAHLRMTIKQVKNPRLIQVSKRKIGILSEIFK